MVNDLPDLSVFERIQPVGHTGFGATLVASLLGVLPTFLTVLGSFLGIIWFTICIYESRTFQHWLAIHRMKTEARRLAKWKAQETITLARIAALETIRASRTEARELVESAKADAAALVVHETAVAATKAPPI